MIKEAPYGHYITEYFDENLTIDFNCSECDQGNHDQPVTLFEFECGECGTVFEPLDFFDNEEFFRLALHSAVNARNVTECLRIIRSSLSREKTERVAKKLATLLGIKFVDTRQVLECITRNYRSEMIESLDHSDASKRYGWFWPYEKES